jgi:hypothetical protein
MKRILLVLWSLMLTGGVALSLTQSQLPPKFGVPWANGAGAAYIRSIPQTSQIGIQNCAASLTDGMPPLTFALPTAGGCPPFGQDFNGILKQLSQWNQWQAAGGPVFYDGTFATNAGGYPSGARLQSLVTPGTTWFNTVDSNSTNPDASTANQIVGGTGWVQDPGQIPVGTPIQSLTTTIPFGQVSANGLTIGNASSNGTSRANADTQFLFAFVWNSCSSTACPIYTSTGSASTHGANAAADFAANKAIAVPNMNGLALMGADSQNGSTSLFLVGVPVTRGSRTVPLSVVGEYFHSITSAENGPHTHANTLSDPGHSHANTLTDPGHHHTYTTAADSGAVNLATGGYAPYNPLTQSTSTVTTGITINNADAYTGMTINNVSSGSGLGHNTVEGSMIVYWNLKL